MSRKPKDQDKRPERRADHEEREHRAAEGEALAEYYRILMEAGALEPKDGGRA